jgi:hypothetical protein
MDTIAAAGYIATTDPAINYHCYVVYKSKLRMMAVAALLSRIIPSLTSPLLSITGDDSTAYIQCKIIKL